MRIEPKSVGDRVSAHEADRLALAELVASLGNPVCVEIGAYIGHTAMAMVEGGAKHVYSIDLWSGDLEGGEPWRWKVDQGAGRKVLAQFCERVPLLDRVTPLVGDSLWWAARWPWPVDLVFIDGGHAYESCAADIRAWWPHVKQGGILCGHDFGDYCRGVIKSVEESGQVTRAGRTIWWRRKCPTQDQFGQLIAE